MRTLFLALLIPALACLVRAQTPVYTNMYGIVSVPGQPFVADLLITHVQTLADGNRITRKATSHVARDSQGRIRLEMPGASDGNGPDDPGLILIYDSVAKVNYALNTRNRTATRRSTGTNLAAPNGSPDVRQRQSHRSVTTESLGSRTIEGLTATGSRVTTVYPPGEIGNERPIVVTSERWYCSELHAVMMTRNNDPRSVDVSRELTNIERIEPPASLFDIPTDYKIVEPEAASQ